MPYGVVVFRSPEVDVGIVRVLCVVGEELIGLEAEGAEVVLVVGELGAEM